MNKELIKAIKEEGMTREDCIKWAKLKENRRNL